MKDKVSSMKHMEELLEDIMMEKKLCRRSYELGCGVQLCTKIRRSIIGHAMSIRGLESHCGGMNYI